MGCRRYFVASRLEVLVDEDDSRFSSRALDLGNVLLVSQLHVAIQTLCSTDTGTQLFTGLSRSPVCAFTVKQDTFVDFLSTRTRWLLTLHMSPCSYNWIFWFFCWVCWESSLPPATSDPNSFIQLSSKEIFGGGRGDAYTFSYMISPVSITIAFGIQ